MVELFWTQAFKHCVEEGCEFKRNTKPLSYSIEEFRLQLSVSRSMLLESFF